MPAHLGALVALDAIALDARDRFGRAMLRRAVASAVVRVALVRGKIVGFALARERGRVLRLIALAVAPKSRRRGVGRALLASLMRLAKRRKFTLRLAVRADNVVAQRLYDRAGLRAVGVRAGYYPDGAAALMYEELGHVYRHR